MMPFMTQPAVAPACYVPRERQSQSQAFRGAQILTRTPTVAGHSDQWTWRAMVCVGAGSSTRTLMSARPTSVDYEYLSFQNGQLRWAVSRASDPVQSVCTAQVFRSPGWYDILIRKDLTAPAGAACAVIEINGVAVTSFVAENYPDVSASYVNGTGLHSIGAWALPGEYHDGLMADVYMIDGTAVPMSAFGEFNIHGVWVPKPRDEIHAAIAEKGGFGANGFHLDFSDPLNPGKDVSGKGNHWNAVGFDATGKDTVSSSPTNVYATGNPLIPGSAALSNGGLTATWTSGGAQFLQATLPVRAPIYFEVTADNAVSNGVNRYPYVGFSDGVTGVYLNGNAVSGSVNDGDVLGVATDGVSAWVRKNGVWQNGDPTLGGAPTLTLPTDGLVYPFAAVAGSTAGEGPGVATINFGQRPFNDAPPSGFKPLCTDNLPEPDIKDPGEAFAQVATTGAQLDALLKSTTGHWNGAPYVEIVKRRDASEDWRVRFSDDPGNAWATNNAFAKAAAPSLVSEGAYVGYRLRVGARYGVWTAEKEHTQGTATTITHDLNTDRAVVIATRVSAGGGDRYFRHPDMAAGDMGKLNSHDSIGAEDALAAFGSNSFQIAATEASGTYRVIVLAERPGYLALPSWKGNESEDGPFVPLDIAPLFMLSRQSLGGADGSGDWEVLAEATSPINPRGNRLFLNENWKEDAAIAPADFVAGGVKLRIKNADWNESGRTYYAIAIGRPIGGVCVAPATAR